MTYFLALFMFSSAIAGQTTSLTHTPTAKQVAQQEEQDFLFLAEEEPEMVQPAEPLPDTTDEEVIGPKQAKSAKVAAEPVCKMPCDPALPPFRDAPKKPYSEHRKIEDLSSELLPPNFCIRKKLGCFNLSGKFLPDGYWAQSTTLLNKCADADRNFLVRHTFDLNVEAISASERYGDRTAELKMTIRNKGTWGLPGSVAVTTPASINAVGVTFGEHAHGLSRHVLWLREVWLSTLLNAVLRTDENLPKHFFKLGLFPWQLGHGISYGVFYNSTPGLVGFYSDNAADQFAPGFLFTGEFIKDRVKYDLYGAIIQNFSTGLRLNSDPIYAQRFGFQAAPERGFGHVNWLVSARMELIPMQDPKWGTLEVEPYILYNQVPEQRIDFPADAAAKLTTAGFEIDYANGPFEMSYEFAHNFGRQRVFGWDNNVATLANQNGTVVVTNSKVTNTATGQNALVIPANQTLINAVPQSEAQNGQFIGTASGGTGLQNASDRFSNPYTTLFRGWMMIGEAAYWFFEKQVGVAVGGGIATGDENPNVNATDYKAPLPDGKYQGFIGLQEGYTRELVESALFLGLRDTYRPLSLPDDALSRSFFASRANGFTNLVYFGSGLHCKPKIKSKIQARTNIIAFWQQDPTNRFDLLRAQPLPVNASNFYGLELNLFFDIFPLDYIKNTLVAGIFFPGPHYTEIRGIPLDSDQVRRLRINASLPNKIMSDDKAFFFNLRMEYRF